MPVCEALPRGWHATPNPRGRALPKCVPRQSLGTRNNRDMEGCLEQRSVPDDNLGIPLLAVRADGLLLRRTTYASPQPCAAVLEHIGERHEYHGIGLEAAA